MKEKICCSNEDNLQCKFRRFVTRCRPDITGNLVLYHASRMHWNMYKNSGLQVINSETAIFPSPKRDSEFMISDEKGKKLGKKKRRADAGGNS